MAKKKNRGKKAGGGGGGGVKPGNVVGPDSQGTTSTQDKNDTVTVKTDSVANKNTATPTNHINKTGASLNSVTVSKSNCNSHAADIKDQGAFLSEFESKALQAATQTQQAEPQIVEKVVEVIKVVEKEVKVEDPALKARVEELAKENAQLRIQVADLEKNTSSPDDSQRAIELEEEVRTVTEKVTHYQAVLGDTENLLKSLQASVEGEEATWSHKLSEKESDMKQLVADKANLELQVKTLEDTLDKVKKAEDMQEQLEGMKEQLQKEEKDKISLLEKLQQAQEQLTNTATQGGTVGGGDDDELRTDNDKLRALVTVGQDENREQEKLIEQLQRELSATKTVSTNGPASEDHIQEGAGASQ